MHSVVRGTGTLKDRDEVVYYESLNRAIKTKTMYGYRCDERLKTNVEESALCCEWNWNT